MAKIKITVMKRDLYKDLIDKYANNKDTAKCETYADGQEFVTEWHTMPEGFCCWAWADIHRDIVAVGNGASYPWMKQEGSILTCCTDGMRPVTFKIERLAE